MDLKVGHRHHPRKNEGHRTCEESEKEKQTAEEFKHPSYPHLREALWAGTGGQESEKLLCAVLHEEKSRNDTQNTQQTRRPSAPTRIHFSHIVLQIFLV